MSNVFRNTLAAAVIGLGGLIASGAASATAGYCIAPAPQTTDGLTLSDAVFTIGATNYSPVDCYGLTDTGSSDVANNLTFVNNLRWENFVNGVKDDVGGGSNVFTVNSIQFTLTAGADTGSGTNQFSNWTLSWSDTNGAAAPNLPVDVDFALQWNGGNNDAFYLFQNVVLTSSPTTGSGTINIRAMNNPGNSDLGTSHIDLFFTTPVPDTRSVDQKIPEPSTILLIGAALLVAASVNRRTRA